jgi:CheY-like chemotaxis protein
MLRVSYRVGNASLNGCAFANETAADLSQNGADAMKMPLGAGPEPPLILIVEDASFNLHAERITLEASGYRVIKAEEGAAALLLATLHRPDLILLDLGLPDMNGTAVITRLKGDVGTRHTPVVVCTADDSPESKAECIGAGCAGYLLKPFSSEELLAEVSRVLGAREESPPTGPLEVA